MRQRLEIAAFVVVFAVGIALTAVGIVGGGATEAAALPHTPAPSGGVSVSPRPPTGPTGPTGVIAPTGPTGVTLPTGPTGITAPAGGLVMTTSANSNISSVGCRASMSFTWEIDLSTAPQGRDAVVEVAGPSGSRRYHLSLHGSTVELAIDAPIPGPHAEWTGNLLTVGGRDVFETPLPVSVDVPTC
jgi:hypothetical protein